MKNIAKLFVIFFCVIGCDRMYASEIQPFFLQSNNRSVEEFYGITGYFLPPATSSSPIIFAIQGSSCESVSRWSETLADLVQSLGLGLIVLEKQGISHDEINLSAYNQNNYMQNRHKDYIFCLENIAELSPDWNGMIVFLGVSEGGMLAANLASHTSKT